MIARAAEVSVLIALIAGNGTTVLAADPQVRFESQVLPLFQAKCLPCHSAKTRQGGLSLETRDEVLRGGKTGAAAVPGKPSDSILLSVVISGKMPMGGARLSEPEIDLLRSWIESGALKDGETVSAKLVSEREVFAILGGKCLVCHGRRVQKAGLDLRSRESLLKGGKSGPAITPGDPEKSLLVQRIASQQMPPPALQEQFSVRGLMQDELEKVKAWIARGAPPEGSEQGLQTSGGPGVSEKDRQHWAFRPPVRPAVPAVQAQQARNPVDTFLLAKLAEKSLSYSEPADRATLLRRATLDMTGLPPTAAELEAFLADRSPDAYGKVVDRLLASPRYGERWARFWLDAAGYADSEGAVSADNIRHFAWRYRDYVIRSLNADKPYDVFLTEQIAGDELFDYKAQKELTADQIEKLVATGFLRMGPDSTYSTEQNFIPERFDTIAGEIEILGTSVMGLTIGCARCHDHKYDPIPQRDYYRLSAVLQTAYDPFDWMSPSQECVGVGAKCDDANTRFLPLQSAKEQQEVEESNRPVKKRIEELEAKLDTEAAPFREKLRAEKLEKLPAAVRQDLLNALSTPAGNRTAAQVYLVEKVEPSLKAAYREVADRFREFDKTLEKLQPQIRAERAKLKPTPRIRALFDMGGQPTPNRVLLRGDPANPGALVEPGGPSILSASVPAFRVEKPDFKSETSGRRLALARWLTHPNHPLTSRVIVNRIWQHHFGTGLVASSANFGKTGTPPTHPELLDWLATELVRSGWKLKAIHRLILTSDAYMQTSHVEANRRAADPDNRLLSRFPLRRMDADMVYDSVLRVAERLDETMYGPPAEIAVKEDGEVVGVAGKHGYRRAIYLEQRRSRPVTMLETFDAPLLSPNCIRRGQSVVSLQALQLLNSAFVRESASYLAGRVIDAAGDDPKKQAERAYLAILSRRPSEEESAEAVRILLDMRASWRQQLQKEKPAEPVEAKAQWKAAGSLCHTLINSAEFSYVD